MSYIRMGQSSEYVDLGDGSREYLYDNGHSISGTGFSMDYGDWIGALSVHAELAGLDDVKQLERSLENHYGVHRNEVQAVGPRPEMAHTVAQHLDSRLDGWELTDEAEQKLAEYAEQAFVNCPECGDRWRPDVYITEMQGNKCRNCWTEELKQMDVSCDTEEMEQFVRALNGVPTDEDDDEFYALTMEQFMEREGAERNALAHQLGEAADEIQEANIENREVDKERVLTILESVSHE